MRSVLLALMLTACTPLPATFCPEHDDDLNIAECLWDIRQSCPGTPIATVEMTPPTLGRWRRYGLVEVGVDAYGLQRQMIVAHEVGHALGWHHDRRDAPCDIMRPMIDDADEECVRRVCGLR